MNDLINFNEISKIVIFLLLTLALYYINKKFTFWFLLLTLFGIYISNYSKNEELIKI